MSSQPCLRSSRVEEIHSEFQREAAGIHGFGAPLEDFGVPGEVRTRIGARPAPEC